MAARVTPTASSTCRYILVGFTVGFFTTDCDSAYFVVFVYEREVIVNERKTYHDDICKLALCHVVEVISTKRDREKASPPNLLHSKVTSYETVEQKSSSYAATPCECLAMPSHPTAPHVAGDI